MPRLHCATWHADYERGLRGEAVLGSLGCGNGDELSHAASLTAPVSGRVAPGFCDECQNSGPCHSPPRKRAAAVLTVTASPPQDVTESQHIGIFT